MHTARQALVSSKIAGVRLALLVLLGVFFVSQGATAAPAASAFDRIVILGLTGEGGGALPREQRERLSLRLLSFLRNPLSLSPQYGSSVDPECDDRSCLAEALGNPPAEYALRVTVGTKLNTKAVTTWLYYSGGENAVPGSELAKERWTPCPGRCTDDQLGAAMTEILETTLAELRFQIKTREVGRPSLGTSTPTVTPREGGTEASPPTRREAPRYTPPALPIIVGGRRQMPGERKLPMSPKKIGLIASTAALSVASIVFLAVGGRLLALDGQKLGPCTLSDGSPSVACRYDHPPSVTVPFFVFGGAFGLAAIGTGVSIGTTR